MSSRKPMREKTTESPSEPPSKTGASETPNGKGFESWAIVEVMGHNTFAGLVSEFSLGGTSFIRVDVPAIETNGYASAQPAFTKLIGASSIYAITPCSREIAEQAAARVRVRPIQMLSLEGRPALSAHQDQDED